MYGTMCIFVYLCRLQVTSLTRLFKTRGFVPRMVFCGSCDSRLFGEALVKAGVRHVVAAAVEKQDGLSGEDAQDLHEAQYTVANSVRGGVFLRRRDRPVNGNRYCPFAMRDPISRKPWGVGGVETARDRAQSIAPREVHTKKIFCFEEMPPPGPCCT